MAARVLNVRLPDALYQRIEELAKATARSKSFLAIHALSDYVQREAWQIQDIGAGLREADTGEFATEEEVARVLGQPET